MKTLTIRHTATEVPKPWVLTRRLMPETGFYSYSSRLHSEPLYRVKPANGADVKFLQKLVRDKERFVPIQGEGLLISHNALMSC